jgi:hypothetical protein
MMNSFGKNGPLLLLLAAASPAIAIAALVEARRSKHLYTIPVLSLLIWLAVATFIAALAFSD